MTNTPQWRLDENLTPAQLWEKRAREQAERAEKAEARAQEAEKTLAGTEEAVPVAVGKTPEAAIKALAKAKGWGQVKMGEPLDSGVAANFSWGYRFHADGISFKAAGCTVPGGVTLTWWS